MQVITSRLMCLAAMGSALLSPAGDARPVDGYTMQNVAFLAGCWEGRLSDGTTIRETYTSPRAGSVLGNSQLAEHGSTRFFEFIRIAETGGKVSYLPYPNGKLAASFPLVKAATDEVVFENASNDFPQRIVYDYDSKSAMLTARIEMLDGSKSESFPMKASPCGVGDKPAP